MKFEKIKSIFSRIPVIETPRLLLRKMRVTDAKDMFEYAKRSDVTRYLLWSPHPNVDHTREYLGFLQSQYKSGDFYDWAVVDTASGKMIGTCGFTSLDFNHNAAEVGYVLNPAFRGRGIAPEALARVLDFGFRELNVHRIEAKYIVGNDASRRVMEKCGMHFEGIRRGSMFIKGEYRDIGYCSILSDEYIARL